jgi:hypothetical protein
LGDLQIDLTAFRNDQSEVNTRRDTCLVVDHQSNEQYNEMLERIQALEVGLKEVSPLAGTWIITDSPADSTTSRISTSDGSQVTCQVRSMFHTLLPLIRITDFR